METMENSTADVNTTEAKKPRRGFTPEAHHLEAAAGTLHKEIFSRASLQLRSGVEISAQDALAIKAAVRFNEAVSDLTPAVAVETVVTTQGDVEDVASEGENVTTTPKGENIEDAAKRLGVKSGFMLNTLKGVRRGRPITTKNAIHRNSPSGTSGMKE